MIWVMYVRTHMTYIIVYLSNVCDEKKACIAHVPTHDHHHHPPWDHKKFCFCNTARLCADCKKYAAQSVDRPPGTGFILVYMFFFTCTWSCRYSTTTKSHVSTSSSCLSTPRKKNFSRSPPELSFAHRQRLAARSSSSVSSAYRQSVQASTMG